MIPAGLKNDEITLEGASKLSCQCCKAHTRGGAGKHAKHTTVITPLDTASQNLAIEISSNSTSGVSRAMILSLN